MNASSDCGLTTSGGELRALTLCPASSTVNLFPVTFDLYRQKHIPSVDFRHCIKRPNFAVVQWQKE